MEKRESPREESLPFRNEFGKDQDSTNARYKLLFERSLNPIAVTDVEFKFKEINQAFCEMLGYTSEELLKLSMPHISAKDSGDKSIFLIKKMISGEIDNFTIGKKYKHKDGSTVYANTAVRALTDEEGVFQGSIASIQEITLEQLKSLQDSNAQLKIFALSISHDLNAPLKNILGVAQMLNTLDSVSENDEAKQYVEIITDSVNRMSNMITGILNQSVMSTIGDKNTLLQIELEDVLKDVKSNLQLEIDQSRASINFQQLYQVKGYYSEMIQLFQNIISNSIKYRKKGRPPVISISAEHKENGIEFTFCDNGVGIARNAIAGIWQEFNRGTQTAENGHGIGLATCKRIVDAYQGKVSVESELNIGTTIRILLGNRK